MPALRADLLIERGSRYRLIIDVTVDWLDTLTGYNARGLVRESHTIPDSDILADFEPYLTVDVGTSQVLLDIPADVTAEYDWSTGHYDLELFDGDVAHDVRFVQGQVRVDPEVTYP